MGGKVGRMAYGNRVTFFVSCCVFWVCVVLTSFSNVSVLVLLPITLKPDVKVLNSTDIISFSYKTRPVVGRTDLVCGPVKSSGIKASSRTDQPHSQRWLPRLQSTQTHIGTRWKMRKVCPLMFTKPCCKSHVTLRITFH